MKIRILSIEFSGDDVFVKFESEVGQGFAKWMSKRVPSENYWYDVEIDIEKKICEAAIPSDINKESNVEIKKNKILLSGFIESIESDGIAYLRLCKDGLVMIEVGSDNFSEGDHIVLELDPSSIQLTAQGL